MNFRSIIVLIIVLGCAEEQSSSGVPLTTVDSNILSLGDSTPAILHLDRPDTDSAYEVALDSVGKTITQRDTASKHR